MLLKVSARLQPRRLPAVVRQARRSGAATGPWRNGRLKKHPAPDGPHGAHRPICGAAKHAASVEFAIWRVDQALGAVPGGADQPNAEVSGRLITTSFMTKVDVMRCIPGKAVSFSS